MNTSPSDERSRLEAFWNSRYVDFRLSESGWAGAGEPLNRRLYDCKTQALTAALAEARPGGAGDLAILDAGCGQGYFARFYQERHPSATYVGLDISVRAVAHLRETMPHGEFHVADLCAWHDPVGRRFDIVQAFEVLHLILDDALMMTAFANLALHVKPGGHLLVTAVRPPETLQPTPYVRYRSRAWWDDLIARLGLRVVSARPMYYWLPNGGPSGRVSRYAFNRMGTTAMYVADRVAGALRLPQSAAWSADCRMHLLTIGRR